MDSASVQIATSKFVLLPNASAAKVANPKKNNINFASNFRGSVTKIHAIPPNGSVSSSSSRGSVTSLKADENKRRSNLESLFCYDKGIPEERIEKPVGLCLEEKAIGNNARCTDCQAKGAVLCATCAGSGLYIDSILESQGIIVKVRCLANEESINGHFCGITLVHYKAPNSTHKTTYCTCSNPTKETEDPSEIQVYELLQSNSNEHLPSIRRCLHKPFVVNSNVDKTPPVPTNNKKRCNPHVATNTGEHELICVSSNQTCGSRKTPEEDNDRNKDGA
ncbi:hypothetical protein CR513_25669, partial [Mucuna pruriens]